MCKIRGPFKNHEWILLKISCFILRYQIILMMATIVNVYLTCSPIKRKECFCCDL